MTTVSTDPFFPKIGKYAIAVLREKQQQGKTILLKRTTPGNLEVVKCSNCNDLGVTMFQIGGYSSKSAIIGAVQTWSDGKFYKVEETLSFVCPVCNALEINRYDALAENSGLQPNELQWHVNYFQGDNNKGLPGKQAAYKYALDFLMSIPTPKGLLLLYGNNGTGKSGLLKAMVAQSILAGVPAHYTTAAAILSTIRATYGDTAKITEQDLMSWYGGYPVLVIDEVDIISSTGWAETVMRDLINGRYDRRFTSFTGLATNMTPEDLQPYLNSRWEDGQRILVGGQDLRGNNG
jgi:DNA replication protein DnaC